MKVDSVSFASGAVIVVLGALVLVDSADAINVSGGWGAVVITGTLGLVLLVSGLMDRGADRRDRPDT
jgi:hypothetical protein